MINRKLDLFELDDRPRVIHKRLEYGKDGESYKALESVFMKHQSHSLDVLNIIVEYIPEWSYQREL